MNTFGSHHKSAAALGGLLILPFVALNAVVANRMEPFFTIIRPGIHTSPVEYVLLFIVLSLLPIGAFIAIRPLFQKGADGARTVYLSDCVVAAGLLLVFAWVAVGLGSDIYRCDILKLPNCD